MTSIRQVETESTKRRSVWPPRYDTFRWDNLVRKAREFAFARGLQYLPQDRVYDPNMRKGTISAPFSLFPTPFPKSLFHEAFNVQRVYNELYSRISLNAGWLDSAIARTSEVDPFVARLWHIELEVRKSEFYANRKSLGMYRSDYMLDSASETSPQDLTLKQVEFNTISSSFGSLSAVVNQLHRYLISAGAYGSEPYLQDALALPPADSLLGIVEGLRIGHSAYGVTSSVVLMIIPEGERNVFDQSMLEYQLLETHNVRMIRLTMAQLLETAFVSSNGQLNVKYLGNEEHVAVCYWRSGYSPEHYPEDSYWKLRLRMECSRAIHCPTAATQLAGMKLIQQMLSEHGAVEKFIQKPSDVSLLRQSFAEMYPMDSSDRGKLGLSIASDKALCKDFVLKPQREGGGNNIYGQDISEYVQSIQKHDSDGDQKQSKLEGYILMALIKPPTNNYNFIMNAGESVACIKNTISELGIYGVCLFDAESIIRNETVGCLLRTKDRKSNEGGVAVGQSALDTPLLI